MTNLFINMQNITFSYDSQIEPLFANLNVHLHKGWTGITGVNGTGKTTLLKLACGLLKPLKGKVTGNAHALYCDQQADSLPAYFEDFLVAADQTAGRLQDRMQIDFQWLYRWDTLSFGERKRVQVATALWCNPAVLAMDEPTNHLDATARDMVYAALADYDGIGLLVSHDRLLMDRLCTHCLFTDPPSIVMRTGNLTKGIIAEEEENAFRQKQYRALHSSQQRLKQEMARRRQLADQPHRISKKGIPRKDKDAKGKIDLARFTGKDAVGGKLLRQLEGRFDQAEQKLTRAGYRKTRKLGIGIRGMQAERDWLFFLPSCSLTLDERRTLQVPDLHMHPGDRICLTGGNGTGKSTLIRRIAAGISLPAEHVIYIPQEIARSEIEELTATLHTLPHNMLGMVLAFFSRLGSMPERLLTSELPSPGEVRKLMLAFGLCKEPQLIIMDEPTNHMDMHSIRCLEEALANCAAGLLLVSHDTVFLNTLTSIRWNIAVDPADCSVLRLNIPW